jgi:hypothetical protein
MKNRSAATAIAGLCAAFLLLPATAGAQDATSFNDIPIKGTVAKGKSGKSKSFSGQYTVTGFKTSGGKTFAVGDLTGRVNGKRVTKDDVAMPVTLGSSSNARAAQAACPVLNLQLGPIDLNLLGLRVQLGGIGPNGQPTLPIGLRITAIPGSGNLLGNLLCNVAGLLNPPQSGTLSAQEITALLNLVITLINNPPLGGLNAPAAPTG